MKGAATFALTLLVLGSVTIINGCGGSSSPTITTPPITVSVSAGSNSVQAAQAAPLTATVNGDPSGKGVTWTVSCSAAQCGSVSPTTTPSGVATTYTAPSTPPASDLTVTVKASSVADASKSGSASITVSAISVSVSPTTATVLVGAGNIVQMNANVNNDPLNQGVSWTISPASQAGNLNIQDPFAAVYNAPTTLPASDLTVTVTATSKTDSTKSATVTITVPFVTISITPSTATVDATGNVPNIIATVGNDASGKGVRWSVSCSPAPCGSVSPTTTASGAAATYTAPTVPPSPTDLTVTVTATSVADSAAQTAMTITVKAISVSVTAPASTVQFGKTVPNIVAVVNDDPAKKGVTWAIQPCGVTDCGSISSNATASGAAITYTAPSTPPASNLPVTITATSDSDPNQQGSVQITVLAITVSVSPASAIIPVNATAALNATPFTPAVNNDSSNQGVSWTLTQSSTPCSPVCGTITLTNTASGTPTVYSAPATVPASPTVTLTATSVADATKQATATITLTAGTVKLIPANLNFGMLVSEFFRHPTKILSTTLTNTGASTLSITSQTTTAKAFFVSTPCQGGMATNVASGSSCNISVTFAPPTTGLFNANLSIADNDISSPQQVPLSGRDCTFIFPFRSCSGAAEIRQALINNRMAAVPSPTGPNNVGTRVMDLVDATRSDPYLANGTKRELLVRFWYPMAPAQGCKPAEYTSSGVWNYLAQLERVPAPQVKTNSCQDASVATGTHPVVIFTHGYSGTFTDYTFLFEDLASRGYVVASVDHTFEATALQFPDGRLAKSVFGSHLENTLQMNEQSTAFAVAVRLSDLKFALDELESLNASTTSPFVGKLDLSRVAIAGHSLGGTTALLAIELDPRFRAAISMDAPTPGPLFSPTEKPILMLVAGRDWDADACRLWSGLRGPRLALNFKGSEHLTPSDAVWLANGAIQTGTVGMESTVAAIRNYIAAFLETNLKGNPTDPLLKDASSDYPDVQVTTQTQSPCGEAIDH
jgi:dienelactone hydrolase